MRCWEPARRNPQNTGLAVRNTCPQSLTRMSETRMAGAVAVLLCPRRPEMFVPKIYLETGIAHRQTSLHCISKVATFTTLPL